MSFPSLPIGPACPWLAPLAGYSDLAFRLLCREEGAAVACTEMVSAKGLVYGAKGKPQAGTEDLLLTTPEDAPLVVQLFGAEANFLEEAVVLLRDRGFAWFDLNMGCSVPKVVKTGAGAAMLKDIPNALAAAEAMLRAAGPGRVGFKLRLGWDFANATYMELAKGLEALGAGWITLHPRYARQAFSGTADWGAIAALKKALSIPVIASGDLFSGQNARECLAVTGADSVMFARGAMGNPAIFKDFLEPGRPAAAPEELYRLILAHTRLARRHVPGRQGRTGLPQALIKMRSFVPRYVRHMPGVKHLRPALSACRSWEELEGLLQGFFLNEGGSGL